MQNLFTESDVVTRWIIKVFNKVATSGRMSMCQYYKKKIKKRARGRKKITGIK